MLQGLILGVALTWAGFQSTIYPYAIDQPSSFRHVVLSNTAEIPVDYFFPSKGSFVTNVNVSGQPGTVLPDERDYLRSLGGMHVHRVGWVRLVGRRLPLTRADFHNLAGSYRIEQVRFIDHKRIWQLTASYGRPFRWMRPTMLRMLASFRPR